MEIKRFIFGPFETNCYVVTDADSMLLIDSACSNEYEQQELLDYIISRQSNISHPRLSILATHGHLDHLWGAKWATEQFGVPVMMHEADIPLVQAMQQQYSLFGIRRRAESFPIEKMPSSFDRLSVIPTPGHTPGSVCIYYPDEKLLLSGDTLFRMGYGRTDLPGGDYVRLIDSIERLFSLPADVRVLPGHGDYTTIGEERR